MFGYKLLTSVRQFHAITYSAKVLLQFPCAAPKKQLKSCSLSLAPPLYFSASTLFTIFTSPVHTCHLRLPLTPYTCTFHWHRSMSLHKNVQITAKAFCNLTYSGPLKSRGAEAKTICTMHYVLCSLKTARLLLFADFQDYSHLVLPFNFMHQCTSLRWLAVHTLPT